MWKKKQISKKCKQLQFSKKLLRVKVYSLLKQRNHFLNIMSTKFLFEQDKIFSLHCIFSWSNHIVIFKYLQTIENIKFQ